jgi:hypothetical protein
MDRRPGFDHGGLERALVDLGPALALPAEPDLVARVSASIRAGSAPRDHRVSLRPRRALAFVTAAFVLIVTSLALAFSPAAREAVADFLGIGGVRIKVGPERGPTPTAAPGENLSLGVETTLAEAQDRVDFPIRVPSVLGLPPNPNAVYHSDFPPGGRVSLVYRAQPDWLPEARASGVGLLIMEFEGAAEPDFAKKLSAEHQVEFTDVNGSPAYWVEGQHTLFFLDANGRQRTDTLRLSANALIWTEGDMTLRLESELELEDALTIAESMS